MGCLLFHCNVNNSNLDVGQHLLFGRTRAVISWDRPRGKNKLGPVASATTTMWDACLLLLLPLFHWPVEFQDGAQLSQGPGELVAHKGGGQLPSLQRLFPPPHLGVEKLWGYLPTYQMQPMKLPKRPKAEGISEQAERAGRKRH